MHTKKVSIIVPVYNTISFLQDCILSLINQNYDNMEILIIDDGSQSQVIDQLYKYEEMNSCVKVITKEHSGVSTTRNLGIQNSTGDYIIFVDSDDCLMNNSIRNLIEVQQKLDSDIVFGMHCYGYGNKTLARIPRVEEGSYEYSNLCDKMIDNGTMTGILFGSVTGNLYKRSFIINHHIRFEQDVTINEDGLFNLDLLIQQPKIFQFTKEPTYYYRQWKDGRKKDYKKMEEAFKICDNHVFTRIYPNLSQKSMETQKQYRIITESFQLSLAICESLTLREATKILKQLWTKKEISINEEQYSLLNRYKRVMLRLLTKKHYTLFYLFICYSYPILKTVIKR